MNAPIPAPRPNVDDRRARGQHITAYCVALEEMRRWAAVKENRAYFLRSHYEKRGKDEVSIIFLIDQDQDVREAQVLLDRATARAAALGPAALLESMGLLK